ncbi:MAG: M20/M25/M40 family metallo-hydrolase [Acidobacteria bacterium]|nr:M20/M25/M40 family metallo-hydrolase [Acidobacteriota bacterium]
MRHKFLPLLLVIALAAAALSQDARTAGDAPDPERLRADVKRLASDEMDGRRTGTPGAQRAAEFVAAEFRRIGLRPAGADSQAAGDRMAVSLNKYFQGFPYVAAVELGKRNAMSFVPRAGDAPQNAHAAAGVDLRIGEDWMPLAWSASGRVERAGVVYVGYGIKAAELSHDDYAGVDVKDRVVLAFAGTPDGDNPHGRFARFADLRFKASAAREHGARALLVVTREENFKDEKLARLRPDEGAAAGDAGLPVVLVSRQVARRAVEAAAVPSVTFEKLEQAANGKPAAGGAGGAGQGAPARANHSAPLKNIAFEIETDLLRREAPAFNVVGVLEGSDEKLRQEAVVIGAHYDHLGRGGPGSLAAREGEVHHGADDNASGTAALVELARLFAAAKERPRRTLVFVAFGGEEEGLLGSNFYVNKNPAAPLAQTVAMLNMDMVGRLKNDKLIVGGVGTAAEWKELIERANGPLRLGVTADGRASGAGEGAVPIVTDVNGRTIVSAEPRRPFALTLDEDGFGPSDHSSFYARQVPVLFFWTGTHEDYHKPSDTAGRINYDGLARVAAFVRDVVRAVDAADKRPTYAAAKTAPSAGRSAGFRVYLGTIPSYAEGSEGMKLDGVRDDSPAAAAGLKAGDVIVRMAGRDVKNVYDYTYALGGMKAGEEYEVEVVRGGQRLKLKLTPAARK